MKASLIPLKTKPKSIEIEDEKEFVNKIWTEFLYEETKNTYIRHASKAPVFAERLERKIETIRNTL